MCAGVNAQAETEGYCETLDVEATQESVDATVKEWSSLSSGYHSGVGSSEASLGEPTALDASLVIEEASGGGDDDSDWGEDEWPVDRALPLPKWGCERPELNLFSLDQFEGFLTHVTQHLQYILASYCYDTISNFIMFSEAYVSSRGEYSALDDFYRDYDPPLLPGRHTCVGLSCLLDTRLSVLEPLYPGLKDSIYKVSCEEEVDNVEWYCTGEAPPVTCEKEHVLLCIRIRICGRPGVVLLDPGYHVGEPIIVMEDGLAPQSEAIRASTARAQVMRSYQYCFWPKNPSFVAWTVTEDRERKPAHQHISLIHVARPFLSGIDVAERRNLAYPFKTLVAREPTGRLRCGLYFPLRDCHRTYVTLFHQMDGLPHHVKVPLSYFLGVASQEDYIDAAVEAVAVGTGRTTDDLRFTLAAVAHLLSDQDLILELTQLNDAIDSISRDN